MTVWTVTCDGEDAAFRANSDDGAPTIEVSPTTYDSGGAVESDRRPAGLE
jgi:hypothetical protein